MEVAYEVSLRHKHGSRQFQEVASEFWPISYELLEEVWTMIFTTMGKLQIRIGEYDEVNMAALVCSWAAFSLDKKEAPLNFIPDHYSFFCQISF